MSNKGKINMKIYFNYNNSSGKDEKRDMGLISETFDEKRLMTAIRTGGNFLPIKIGRAHV